jgi:hypothetical protein
MTARTTILIALGIATTLSPAAETASAPPAFRHHFIAAELPGKNVGLGGLEIADFDRDGDPDVVICDCDGQNSGVAWLENNGQTNPQFRAHYLANRAPGTRGSFHSLWYADFDRDGLKDILVVDQEDSSILPVGAPPRWYLFRRSPTPGVQFVEHVILDARLGGHDFRAADIDGDGDLDIVSKVWSPWNGNANGGRAHVSLLENLSAPTP